MAGMAGLVVREMVEGRDHGGSGCRSLLVVGIGILGFVKVSVLDLDWLVSGLVLAVRCGWVRIVFGRSACLG